MWRARISSIVRDVMVRYFLGGEDGEKSWANRDSRLKLLPLSLGRLRRKGGCISPRGGADCFY